MKRITRLLLASVLAGTLGLTGACTTAPAGGGPILAMGSVEDDVALGREAHPQILGQYGGAVDDPALAAYVQRLGTELKNVSELPELDFTFTVLDNEVVNAFALPGGWVYVSRGLLALAENEAELAGVIGHEIGHVTARHGAARQTTGGLASTVGTLGGMLLGAWLGGEGGARLGAQLGQTAGVGLVMSYSRSQEYEADQLGVRYLDRSGYDPMAMASFLEALEQHSALQAELSGGSAERSTLDSFFASHPNAPDRVARARERAAERPGTGGELDRDALLDVIDGMVYGQSPNQGFIDGQSFAHPVLRLAFEYPPAFQLVNQANAVLGRAENRLLAFDMGRSEAAMSPRRYLEQVWGEGGELDDVSTFRTDGGFDAAIGYATIQLNGRPAQAGLVALDGGDRQFYRFMIIGGRIGQSESRELRAAANSFRRLSAAEAAEFKPLRIQLVTVQPGDTIDDFARRMAVDELPRQHFITLNGLDRGHELTPGERVKIVVEG